jgi:hypothetical protein
MKGYLYVLASQYTSSYGLVKVGCTLYPIHRMYTYNTGDAPGIGLEKGYLGLWEVEIADLNALKKLEACLHRQFHTFRKRQLKSGLWTEWFECSVDSIRSFLVTQPFTNRELSISEVAEIHKRAEKATCASDPEMEDELDLIDEQKKGLFNLINPILSLRNSVLYFFLEKFRVEFRLNCGIYFQNSVKLLNFKDIAELFSGQLELEKQLLCL